MFIKLKLEILFFLFDVDTSFIFFRVFLVRDSSVAGGFVISVTAGSKNIHSQVLPVSSNTFPPSDSSFFVQLSTPDGVVYSLDDGKTKFYDLLQLVEFYQLNAGTLPTRSVFTYKISAKILKSPAQHLTKIFKPLSHHFNILKLHNFIN